MNYNNGQIYILKNYINEYFYVGSSCMPLAKRLYKHKQDLKQNKSITYKKMQDIGITPEVLYIELIELYPCDNVYQLRKKEGEIILKMKDKYTDFCLNSRISGRTDKEYYKANLDVIKETQRIYYKDNLGKFKEKNKKYYIDNLDVIKEKHKDYRFKNYEAIKESYMNYYKANSEAISQKRKDYYKANSDIILQKVGCIACKCMISKISFKKHCLTNKHQKNLLNN